MIHQHHLHSTDDTDTSTEDAAFLAGVRRAAAGLRRHPFALGFLTIVAAAILFRMGIAAGEALYLAFEGDTTTAAAFGGTVITVLVAIIVIGVVADRRRATSGGRGDGRRPPRGSQSSSEAKVSQPSSPPPS
jgi:hypothetical protein